MPSMAQVMLPHVPHHVMERGHNRRALFSKDEDYGRYLEDLRKLSSAVDIRVNRYCLMTNHVHLLLGPGEGAADKGAGGAGHAVSQSAEGRLRYVV